VSINRNAHFGKGNQLSMGDRSSLGYNARIVGDVTLGDDVGLAHNVFITSSGREIFRTDTPIIHQGKLPDKPVVIEDDCLIFAEVIILPGVRIHSGSVIGAGAVVTRDVPPNSIVVGNPAQVVKFRVPPPPDADYSRMTPIACKVPTTTV
jgi:maltose O-acetyltransferase